MSASPSSPITVLDELHKSSSSSAQLFGADRGFVQTLAAGLIAKKITKTVAIVFPNSKELGQWIDFLDYLNQTTNDNDTGIVTAILPELSFWGSDRFLRQNMTVKQRIFALSLLADDTRPKIIATTLPALLQLSLSREDFVQRTIRLKVGDEYNQDELLQTLMDLGYRQGSQVLEEASFAVRGSIIDVFAANHDHPLRLEFVGDELISIRVFSVENQRSLRELQDAKISCSAEFIAPQSSRTADTQRLYDYLLSLEARQEDREGLVDAFRRFGRFQGIELFSPLLRKSSQACFEYFGSKTYWLFPAGVADCEKHYREHLDRLNVEFAQDSAAQKPGVPPSKHYAQLSKFWANQFIEAGSPFQTPGAKQFHIGKNQEWAPYFQTDSSRQAKFEQICDGLLHATQVMDGSSLILAHHEEQLQKLSNLLEHRSLKPKHLQGGISNIFEHPPESGQVILSVGDIANYLWCEDIRCLVIPERLFFGTAKRTHRQNSTKLRNIISSFRDLKVGDLVVHIQHGVGRYRGMESINVGGMNGEFLLIDYAGGDRVYLPVDKLNLLQKYQSSDGASSALDKLRSQGWEKRKSGVRKAVKDMADKLLKIEAERKLKGGFSYSAASDDYFKFEAEFPYDETEDQARAISDVNHDLSSGTPMDRLICGDVGFGKTEVAIRASFRVVLDHRQVMVLVPTTVLCYQHFRTFHGRLSHLGVRVAQVNRFVKSAEIKENLSKFASGEIDILIGTHRLLSKDVKPKNLGLLVIDEEQRFGVTHKEKLKEIRANCDVLTLTATPIPRTLHMAVLGLRDISIITTPPADRRFVKTYVAQFDEQLIRNAIEYEMKRGGQIFFVHNRVEDIQEMANYIKTLVPTCRVGIGHGQMTESALEDVIVDFLEYRFDLLLCTTIIESGIDMPNVNTLITNDADRFGLSQLYQLRGRVGRSDRQAYAYFLTKNPDMVSDEAKKRLDVLLAHQELGSGFQIASHDLELRGAGNLLGGEQSGRIAEVGLELYTQMLDAAIREIRTGQVPEETSDIEIKLPFVAVIPNSYIAEESMRLQIYKNLFSAAEVGDIDTIRRDLIDRFGQMPESVRTLLLVAELKMDLRAVGATQFSYRKDEVAEIRFGTLKEEKIKFILDVARSHPRRLKLSPDFKLLIYPDQSHGSKKPAPTDILNAIISILHPLSTAGSGSTV